MNNKDVEQSLNECSQDLARVKALVDTLGQLSPPVSYLNQYAVIRACGTVEIAFKSIVADHCGKRTKKQVKYYLDRKLRDSSMNPSYENICNTLADFDSDWKVQFKSNLRAHADKDRIKTSIKSLVDARNDFAHGGNPRVSIDDTLSYFRDFQVVIDILDGIMP